MEQDKVYEGVVGKGLAKMMPGKFGAVEHRVHEKLETRTQEIKEHLNKDITCKNCKTKTALGKYCTHCGKSLQ